MTAPTRKPRGAVRTARLGCITLFVAACAFVSPGATLQSPAIRVAGSPAVRGAIAEISRTFEVYIRAFPASAGQKMLISNGGGYQPRWRRDGKSSSSSPAMAD